MLRLDVDAAGAWKTVVPEFLQDEIEGVRESALVLVRAARHRPVAFRIVDLDAASPMHPQGEVLERTKGLGPKAEWNRRS